MKTIYYYGMRLRGFSPGCQPKEGCLGNLPPKRLDLFGWDKYHDVLMYNRPLTNTELEDFELDFLQAVDAP